MDEMTMSTRGPSGASSSAASPSPRRCCWPARNYSSSATDLSRDRSVGQCATSLPIASGSKKNSAR